MCVPAQLSWDWCDLLPLMVSLAVCLEVQKCIAESRKLGFLKATKKVGLQAYWNFLLPLELDETHLTTFPGTNSRAVLLLQAFSVHCYQLSGCSLRSGIVLEIRKSPVRMSLQILKVEPDAFLQLEIISEV